jgi:hypothetical protein
MTRTTPGRTWFFANTSPPHPVLSDLAGDELGGEPGRVGAFGGHDAGGEGEELVVFPVGVFLSQCQSW